MKSQLQVLILFLLMILMVSEFTRQFVVIVPNVVSETLM